MNYTSTINEKEYLKEVLSHQPPGQMLITYLEDWIEEKHMDISWMASEKYFYSYEDMRESAVELEIIENYLCELLSCMNYIEEESRQEEYYEPYSEYESVLPKRQAMRPKLPGWVDRDCGIRPGMGGKVSRKFKRFVLAHPQKDVNALYSKFCKKIKNTSGYENHVAKRLWAQEIKTSYKFSRGGVIHVKPYHPGSPELLAPSTKYPVYALRKKYTISYDGTYCQGVKNSVTLATDTWKYTPTWKEREYAKLYRRDVTMSDGAKFSYDYTPYKAKGKKGADKWCFDGNWNKAVSIRYWYGAEDRKKSATKKEIKKYRLNEISANFEPTVYDRRMK